MRAALGAGVDVVTANKAPLVLEFAALEALARRTGARLGYSGTLGLPLLALREQLAHVTVERMEGVLNGTTHGMLTAMARGRSFDEALREMQDAGLAEADPSLDVGGWDAANKLLILSHVVLRRPATLAEVSVCGIEGVTPEDLRSAAREGAALKLVASAERGPDGSYALRVAPRRLPAAHPLAGLSGTTVGLWVKTDIAGEVSASLTQTEPTPTAAAMLHDLRRLGR